MKKMRFVLMCAVAALFVGNAFAMDEATLAFDEVNQKMHLILADDQPFTAVIEFQHLPADCGEPQWYNNETDSYENGQYPVNTDFHWCELDLFPGNLPLYTPINVAATVHVYSADGENYLETVEVADWNGLQTPNGSQLEYLNDDCTPVIPTSIPINSSFCATICHGSYNIPILCEDPGYTPGTVEVTVTNRCDPATTHCNDPACEGVDWSLFNWQIRVFPGCHIFLTMTYCGQTPGCVCIWRSDFILPVEISAFDATAGDGQVRLNWSTASESDLKNFRVTRSTSRDEGYVELARLNATNDATGANYSFVDESAVNGTTYYYKLHVEDVNGGINVYNNDGQSIVAEATPHAGAVMVSEYSLAQNYPNPFNAQTNFNFTLPVASNVTLTVFDMLGREVATVVDGAMNAGSHTVNWSATGLASGVYMYTLNAGEFTQSNKLLYLK